MNPLSLQRHAGNPYKMTDPKHWLQEHDDEPGMGLEIKLKKPTQ